MTKGRFGHRGEVGTQQSWAPIGAAESNVSGDTCGPSAAVRTI